MAQGRDTSVFVVRRQLEYLYAKLSVESRAGLIVRVVREHMEIVLAGGAGKLSLPRAPRKNSPFANGAARAGRSTFPFLNNWAWQAIAASLGLSDREVDVCRCLMRERCDKQIARDLGIARRTVGRHMDRLYHKLSLHSRAAVVAKVLREHIETFHSLPIAPHQPPFKCCGLCSSLK